MVFLGVYNIVRSAQTLLPPDVYSKDFLQEYLMARALLLGVNPYLPLSELAARFLGPLPVIVFPHPLAAPPPAAMLSIPLGLLGYKTGCNRLVLNRTNLLPRGH
jgi:hypothetical protein